MPEIARDQRSAIRAWAAPNSPHDKLVKTINYFLPIGIGVLTAFLVIAPLAMGGDVSFVLAKDKVEIAKERLKIEQARYRGEDQKGQAFELNAGSAVQRSSSEPIVNLNQLDAALQMQDGVAKLQANTGRYDIDKEQVHVDDRIQFRAPDGYSLDTSNATVDLKTRRMQSGGPVTGTVRQGTFSANQLSADLDGHTVTLTGNARLRIAARAAR